MPATPRYSRRTHEPPPRERAVLLGPGGTAEAKGPLRGRSWLTPRTDVEIAAHTGNFGCRTGDIDGVVGSLCVLDFDAKAGGLDALMAWECEYGPIPGWRVRTGGGGLHIYVAGIARLRSQKLAVLGTGLEVELKANTSYVVFAGSVHESGRRYEPEGSGGLNVLAAAPDWLIRLARGGGISGPTAGRWIRLEGGYHDIPAAVYVEALTGCEVDRRGRALCPLHDDHEPSLQTYPDGHWTCFVCGVSGRIRQLAAITLGLGHQAGHRWEIESHEAPAVYELLGRLFPEVHR